ncbi:MAG: YaeQ family protein [Myxococcota bacterium]
MAQGSTIVSFDVALSDIDRQVYETLSFKVARHPSETPLFLVTRVMAFALEWTEGLAFAPDLSTADTPALWAHDATGLLRAWIEVGTPDAARLHRARKACERVAVYCHRNVDTWLRGLAGQTAHARDSIVLRQFEPEFIAAVIERLERRNTWSLSVTEGALYLDIERGEGNESLQGRVEALAWPD